MAAPELRRRRDSLSDDGSDSELDDNEMDQMVDEMHKEGAEDQNQSKWSKVKACCKEWGETSSCHGVPHMAQAHTLCAAMVWGVILFFAACGFVYLFSSTLAQYLAFSKIVMLNLGMESSNFPSVTFCNINPYKLSKIKGVQELNALLTVYENAGTSGN
ncbi:unnamed protein product, partial [Mesorhabditis belari]|uniref:Uncharacterized protein n=1 Tax=Mesorhabditis belari TaxID=2138241 RepID=A0AAF3J6M1_9BILA